MNDLWADVVQLFSSLANAFGAVTRILDGRNRHSRVEQRRQARIESRVERLEASQRNSIAAGLVGVAFLLVAAGGVGYMIGRNQTERDALPPPPNAP